MKKYLTMLIDFIWMSIIAGGLSLMGILVPVLTVIFSMIIIGFIGFANLWAGGICVLVVGALLFAAIRHSFWGN